MNRFVVLRRIIRSDDKVYRTREKCTLIFATVVALEEDVVCCKFVDICNASCFKTLNFRFKCLICKHSMAVVSVARLRMSKQDPKEKMKL